MTSTDTRLNPKSGLPWVGPDTKAGARISSQVLMTGLVIGSLFLHACYITHVTTRRALDTLAAPSRTLRDAHRGLPLAADARDLTRGAAEWERPLPELFIYRRTKKTGSSSMMAAFLDALPPLGYVALPQGEAEVDMPLRYHLMRAHARRLMVVRHNHVTRDIHPERRAVIADTIRDGFQRMTSFCRFILHVHDCDLPGMQRCWRSAVVIAETRYRWAGRAREDPDTYIDLPLSSAHVGVSTSVMRSLFPNISLRLDRYNVMNSTCNETSELRALYDATFPTLDAEDDLLRKRMLIIAGYPFTMQRHAERHLSMVEMLDAAERLERVKYGMTGELMQTDKMSLQSRQMRGADLKWGQDSDGNWVPTNRSSVDKA